MWKARLSTSHTLIAGGAPYDHQCPSFTGNVHDVIGFVLLFLAPVMLFYAAFVLYPVGATVYNSFHTIEANLGQITTTFVGLDNYKALPDDKIFIQAVKNTFIWSTVGPTLELITAVGLALLVYFKVPFFRFYRVAWFTPMLVSGVIVGLVWRWIFNYDWGLLNVGLRALGLDSLAVNWLGRRDTPLAVDRKSTRLNSSHVK